MPISANAHCENRTWPACLRRHLLTYCASLACLLAVLPAAHAHDDDEMPTPDRIFWGAFFFILTLVWISFMFYHISRPGRKRRFPVRRRDPMPPRLLSWLAWSPPRRPARNASRQVRRANLRRRR
jgi:hypothetical protein